MTDDDAVKKVSFQSFCKSC